MGEIKTLRDCNINNLTRPLSILTIIMGITNKTFTAN